MDISKWTGFCVGAVSIKENLAPILVMSSLSGYYQIEFHKIYLQQVKSGHQITSYLTSFNFVSLM